MACLFFAVPKNNKGSLHYKPLKMCESEMLFLRIPNYGLQEGCTENFVKKTEFWTFRLGTDLIRVFWLGTELLLSSAVERKRGVGSPKTRVGSMIPVVKLITRNVVLRSAG